MFRSGKKKHNSIFGKQELGRSMVEMLGVLAVMGIITMSAVKVYHYTTSRARAHQLMSEANQRAVLISVRIATRKALPLSLAGIKNPTNYTFGVEKNPNNPNQFNIVIEGVVDSDTCAQMKKMVEGGSTVRSISEPCDKLTFNNDLSTTSYPSDYNAQNICEGASYTWCGGSNFCSRNNEQCCSGKSLGPCEACSKGAITTSLKEGKVCNYTQNGQDGFCHNGTCIQKSTDENCTNGGVRCNDTNYGSCCPVGYTCTTNGDAHGTCKKFTSGCTTNNDCTKDNPNTQTPWCKITASSCTNITSGTCSALGQVETTMVYGLGEVVSGPIMHWWNAKNWCEAQGKRLINVEDLQAYRPNSTTLIVSGSGSTAFSCAKQKACSDWSTNPAKTMWNGNILTGAQDQNGELYDVKYSPIVLALAKTFRGNKYEFWTASDYNSSDPCAAFFINLNTSKMSLGYRNAVRTNDGYDIYVLCL